MQKLNRKLGLTTLSHPPSAGNPCYYGNDQKNVSSFGSVLVEKQQTAKQDGRYFKDEKDESLINDNVDDLTCADALGSSSVEKQVHALYPRYSEHGERLRSFSKGWPLPFPHLTPENMAREGFFFLGNLDRVRCFCCGLTLREWEQDDDPYDAHWQWSENCAFIHQRRREKIRQLQQHGHGATPSQPASSSEASLLAATTTSSSSSSTTVYDPSSMSYKSSSSSSSSASASASTSTSTSTTAANVEEEEEEDACAAESESHVQNTKVEAVLEMGFSMDVIQRAIENREKSGLPEFNNAEELFRAVLELENNSDSEGK